MYGTEPRYNEPRYNVISFKEHNPKAQMYNIPQNNEQMPTRDKRKMRNRPTRIKILLSVVIEQLQS